MSIATLISEARSAGLSLYRASDRLVVRGPRAAHGLARRLIDNKTAVLANVAETPTRLSKDGQELVLLADPAIAEFRWDDVPPTEFRPQWDAESLELIEWFAAHRDELPREPLELWPWARVTNADGFFNWIERDIKAGPAGPRARHGVLQEDLQRLRQLFG